MKRAERRKLTENEVSVNLCFGFPPSPAITASVLLLTLRLLSLSLPFLLALTLSLFLAYSLFLAQGLQPEWWLRRSKLEFSFYSLKAEMAIPISLLQFYTVLAPMKP